MFAYIDTFYFFSSSYICVCVYVCMCLCVYMCVCVYVYVCVCISVKNVRCCCSVTKSRLTLCDPVDCSMPGFPVLYYLLEFAQTHAHQFSDAIQLSHPLSPPSPIALSLYQNYSLLHSWLFTSGGQRIGTSASVLPKNIQGWFPLGLTSLISLLSKELSRVFYSTTVQKYQLFSAQPSLWSSSHICMWLLEET